MSRHQEIVFALAGQTFYYDPPEGQPAGTPTVEVRENVDDDEASTEAATTGACSVDSVSTTFSASAGDRSITVASGTGITRGRRYLVADTDGNTEWVDVLGVNGTTIGLRMPLVNDYAAGSTFKGCRISISVDATWVADKANLTDTAGAIAGAAGYRLRWAYTVNSVATIGVSYADLVRYQAKNLVSPLDVDARFPGWIDRLGPDYREDQGALIIAEAFNAVRMDALGDDQVVRRLRDTQVLAELVTFRAQLLSIEHHVMSGGGSMEALTAAREAYERRYKQLLREPKIPIDQSGNGAAEQPQRLPIWRR